MSSLATVAAGHGDPVAPLVLALALLLTAAKLGGDLAVRLGQPAVLGELGVGVLLGNSALIGLPGIAALSRDPTLDLLARVGVLLLLFSVGLEHTVRDMLRVGLSSALTAVLGVAAPFALGYGAAIALWPAASPYTHAFLAATLTATSVGISARVLEDLKRAHDREARIILGAAVIDDVLGLILLAVVSGAVSAAATGAGLPLSALAAILGKSVGFLAAALVLGVLLSRRLFTLASRLKARGVLLALGLSFCFLLSYLADRIGLAPLIGAFAAGLILEEIHYHDFTTRGEAGLEQLIAPIGDFLVPLFFVLMGMRTDLRSFAQPGALGLALVLTVVAILGKLVSALGALPGKAAPAAGAPAETPRFSRLVVGIGMIPRGEVGLIFAGMGAALLGPDGQPVLGGAAFSAVVLMVLATTLVTPPLLKWALARRDRA